MAGGGGLGGAHAARRRPLLLLSVAYCTFQPPAPAAGRLTEVPSSVDQSRLPKRALVPAYAVEEKGGFVWLFFGSRCAPGLAACLLAVCLVAGTQKGAARAAPAL